MTAYFLFDNTDRQYDGWHCQGPRVCSDVWSHSSPVSSNPSPSVSSAGELPLTLNFCFPSTSAFPMASYMSFFARDLATVGASFNMPSPASKVLQENFGMARTQADRTAQVLCPVLIQTFTTPMHLLGLDYYNRPTASTTERVGEIIKHYNKSVAARMARIAPAFGFGGIGNTYFRETYRGYLGSLTRLPQLHHAT